MTITDDSPVAQISLLSGARHGPLPRCAGCREPIDTAEEYYLCWTGTPEHPKIIAAAHPARWDDDDFDDTCPAALRRCWDRTLARAGAARITLGADGGGPRFFAGDIPLHAGVPIDLLGADGRWLAGRFEYQLGQPPTPIFYVPVGGWDRPSPPRHPRRRHRPPPRRLSLRLAWGPVTNERVALLAARATALGSRRSSSPEGVACQLPGTRKARRRKR